MDYKMEMVALLLCVIPAIVTSITITPNGNSPEIKMLGGMTVDVQKGFVPMESKVEETTITSSREKKRKLNNSNNSTKLSINERYRRLIPYMTFYNANDLATPTTDKMKVEIEKADIVDTGGINHANNRGPRKIIYSNRNIPRYQGNRLTQHNIASANPTKIYYKGGVPIYQTPSKVSQNYNPLLSEYNILVHNDYDSGRVVFKQIPKSPGIAFVSSTRKPYLNLYHEDGNIRYYLSENSKYKLVPYEQTPPVIVPENENVYDITKKPVPVPVSGLIPKEHVYLKPRPARPHYVYDNIDIKQANIRKQPAIVSESYYEKQRRPLLSVQPVIQSGFKPILNSPQYSKEATIYSTSAPETVNSDFEHRQQQDARVQSAPHNINVDYEHQQQDARVQSAPHNINVDYEHQQQDAHVQSAPHMNFDFVHDQEQKVHVQSAPNINFDFRHHQQQEAHVNSAPNMNFEELKPHYYQYIVDQKPYKSPQMTSSIPLASLLNSLQLNKSIPRPVTKENVGSSIRTLLQVLNVLKAAPQENNVVAPILSTPKPFVASKSVTAKPVIDAQPDPEREQPGPKEEFPAEPYPVPVNPPSQHLDDIPPGGGTSQHFPLQQTSDDEGGTPGRPGADYPILTTIPTTSFDCKTQRYKGFFADPETRCQVWHYCDLNGGQASFLCPNGTIFSQAGLTCDWWFNVRCAATTQLYVLNESLYKYILPHSPTFPEDYSGPLVDKYLTLKFKEMEEEFKKNKNKQSASEKIDSDEEESDDSEESSTEAEDSGEQENTDTGKEGESAVSEASVVVGSPGESGKVERLHD